MQAGDIVRVSPKTVAGPCYRQYYKDISKIPNRGIVEFVSDRWVTVMLLSRQSKEPIYRQSFWKDEVHVLERG